MLGRAARVVGWTLLGLLSLLVLAVATLLVGIRTQRGARLVVRVGLSVVGKYLAAPITVGRLRTNLWSGLELDDVEMRDIEGEVAAHVDKLTARFSLWPLVRSRMHVSSVRIEGGYCRVRSLRDGRVNFAALLRPRPASSPSPSPSGPPSKFRVEIEGVYADGLYGRYEAPRDIKLPPLGGHVAVSGSVTVVGAAVTVKVGGVNVELDHPGRVTLGAHGGLTVDEQARVAFPHTQLALDTAGTLLASFVKAPELRGRYHLDAEVNGPLSALDLVARVETPSKPIAVDGRLEVGDTFAWRGHVLTRQLDPEPILAGAPHAQLWLDAQGHGTLDGASFAIAHAQIAADRNRVHAAGALELGHGITASGDVQVAANDLSRLRGRGVPPLGGAVNGTAKVRYATDSLRVDAKFAADHVVAPGISIARASIDAHTQNLGGHVLVTARDVATRALGLTGVRVGFDGDRRQFLLKVGAAGNAGTSIDLALSGTPRYERGPFPAGVRTVVNALEVDHNGERWSVEPGAVLAYDHVIAIEGFRARSQRQSLAVEAHIDPARQTIVDADVHAVALDVHRIAALVTRADAVPHSKLDLAIRAHGPFRHPIADVALAGTALRDANKPDEQLHTDLHAHIDAQHLTLRAGVETHAGKISVDASLPVVTSASALLVSRAPLSLKIDGEVKSLAEVYDTIGYHAPPALAALEAAMKLSLSLSGSGAAPVLALELDGDGVRYGPMQRAKLRAKVSFAKSRLTAAVEASLGVQGLSADDPKDENQPAGQLEIKAALPIVLSRMLGRGSLRDKVGGQSALTAEVKLDGIALAALPLGPLGVPALVDGGTLDGQVLLGGVVGDPQLRVALQLKDLKRGAVEHIDARVGIESYAHATQASALVQLGQAPLVSVKARVNHDLGAILAGAHLATTALDATVKLLGFPLDKLGAVVPGLSGALRGQATVRGTLSAPVAEAKLSVDRLTIGGTSFTAFALGAGYASGHAHAQIDAHETSGGSLAGALALDGKSVDAKLDADKLTLDFESVSDAIPIRRLRGLLEAHLSARGAFDAPAVSGSLELAKGTLAVVADPRQVTELALRLDAQPDRITLKTLSGKLAPGNFEVHGDVTLEHDLPQVVDLHAKTHQLPVVQNPIAVAVDTQVDLHGEKQRNVIVGTVKVSKGSARLPSLTNVRQLQDTGALKDVVYVDARAVRKERKRKQAEAAADAGQSTDLRIDTRLPGAFHIRSEELQVDMNGDLTVKVHGPDVSLSGQLQALNGGRLELFGKRYEIERIRVGFDGNPVINPLLDARITRQLGDGTTIGVEVSGTASKPKVTFTSQPPIYSDSQIILAILGSDPGQPQDNTPLADKVGGAVSSLLVGQLKNQIAPHLPIDVIKIDVGDQTNFSQTRLEVGKYIRNNVYVSYVHQFGQLLIGTRPLSANEGSVEYRFRRNYSVDFTIGDAPEGKADLVWTLRY